MEDIEVDGQFGDEIKHIVIGPTAGVGNECYHIYIDKYYCGRVWATEHFGWQNDINYKSGLVTADVDYIIELVQNNK